VIDSEALDQKIISLYGAISAGLAEAVPTRTITSKFAPWWSPNLSLLSHKLRGAKNRLIIDRSEANLIAWKQRNASWPRAVRCAKARYWDTRLSDADTNSIWGIYKTHTRTHNRPIPDFDNASSFVEKVKVLQTQFFSPNGSTSDELVVNSLSSLSDQSAQFNPVDSREISDALEKANSNA
jgi:hypothetical protein